MRDQASFCFRVEERGGWNENVELSKFVPPLTTQIFASSVFLWHRCSEEETPPVSCIVSPAPRVRGKRARAKNRRAAMQLHRCRRTFQLRLLRLRNVNISNSRSFRIKYRCSCELCDVMETVFDAVSQISPLAIFLPEPILTATPEGSLGNPLIYPAGAPGPCWCCTTGATLRPLPPGDTGALLAQFHWLLPCTQQQSTPPSSKNHTRRCRNSTRIHPAGRNIWTWHQSDVCTKSDRLTSTKMVVEVAWDWLPATAGGGRSACLLRGIGGASSCRGSVNLHRPTISPCTTHHHQRTGWTNPLEIPQGF